MCLILGQWVDELRRCLKRDRHIKLQPDVAQSLEKEKHPRSLKKRHGSTPQATLQQVLKVAMWGSRCFLGFVTNEYWEEDRGGHEAIITRFSQSPGITRALDLCSVGCWYETGIHKITPLTHLFGKTSWCSGTAFVPHALPWQSLGCNEVKTYQHGEAMLNPWHSMQWRWCVSGFVHHQCKKYTMYTSLCTHSNIVERFVDGEPLLKVAKAAQRSEKISFLRLRRIKQSESLRIVGEIQTAG